MSCGSSSATLAFRRCVYATQQDVAPTNSPAATSGPIANYLIAATYTVTLQTSTFTQVTAPRQANDTGIRLVGTLSVP